MTRRRGLSENPTYQSWLRMNRACYEPKHPAFAYNGGRKPTPVTVGSGGA